MRTSLLLALACCGAVLGADTLLLDFSPPPLEGVPFGPPRQEIRCPVCKTPPKIDGVLDDAVWKDAAVIQQFGSAKPATVARLCYDRDALYIAVECQGVPGRAVTGRKVPRDGDAYHDDCIEMFLQPDPADPIRVQLVVSAAGSIYDARGKGGADKVGYDPDWTVVTAIAGERWTIEAAIPCAALELKSWHRDIGFNIGRNGPGLKPMSWAGRYGDANAGMLVLEGAPERKAEPVAKQAQTVSFKSSLATTGASLDLSADRLHARPGERWIELSFALRPAAALDRSQVVAALFSLTGATPVARVAATPGRSSGTLWVDLRGAGLDKGRLSVEVVEDGKVTGAATALVQAEPCPDPLAPGARVAVKLDPPQGAPPVRSWPVTFGVPFAAGALWDTAALRVVDGKGRELPCQKEVTARWARDGAAQWVRFDALVDTDAECFVEFAPPTAAAVPKSPVKVSRQGEDITIDTGAARYVLGKGTSPIREIHTAGRRLAFAEGGAGLYLVDQKGRLGSASADGETVAVEAEGPVTACARFEGPYRDAEGKEMARHITRVEAFAGQPFARMTHTLVLTQDSNQVWFRDVGWELRVEPGPDARALFGVSREDWRQHEAHPVPDAGGVSMIQDAHFRFLNGANHFLVCPVGGDGKPAAALKEGEECGDWAALVTRAAGLAVHCRESARQHPKEFQVRRDRIVLRLFSPAAGEELDFRAATLVDKWSLDKWFPPRVRARYKERNKRDVVDDIRKLSSNAIGWAKTHQLLVSPVSPAAAAEEAGRISGLHTFPVYAHVDPKWIYRSDVMGPLHPRDPERFPDVERYVQAVFDYWNARVPEFGEYGFVDYFAGPHLSYGGKQPTLKRYAYTYSLRPYLWLVYARSADRAARELVENTNRTFMDGYMAHWDGPQKTRGLYISGANTDAIYHDSQGCLPFYWDGSSETNVSGSTNLDMFLWYYHLTGYRRAKDCVLEYMDGLKRVWTPSSPFRDWRAIQTLRTITQCYGLTWDPKLRAMAEKTVDAFGDPGGDLLLSKERPYHSTSYKTGTDSASLIEAERMFGDRRYADIARRVAEFWWEAGVGDEVIGYNDPSGLIGNYLFRKDPRPIYAADMALKLRRVATGVNPETGKPRDDYGTGAHNVTYVFRGIPYCQDAVVRTDADRKTLCSWAACQDFGSPISYVLQKGDTQSVEVRVNAPFAGGSGEAGDRVRLRPIGHKDHWGLDLNRITEVSNGSVLIRIPKDAPEGTYVIEPRNMGEQLAMADSKIPMVLHATGYWRPAPGLCPAQRVFFRLPDKSEDAQIFLECATKLFQPDGQPFGDGKDLTGWVSLPPDKPGLWSFVPVERRLVRARNFPPFFAMDDPKHYFEPAIAWDREAPEPPPEQFPKGTHYVPGAVQTPGAKALVLVGQRYFELDAGPPHPSGNGAQFLPHEEGTVEFYFRPNWNSFDLAGPKAVYKSLARFVTDRDPWFLYYIFDAKAGPGWYSYSMYADGMTEGPRDRVTMRSYKLNHIFERNRWYHVAWVWGYRKGLYATYATAKSKVLTMQIFVDGRLGQTVAYRSADMHMADVPRKLWIGYNVLDACVDEMRVSSVQRYTADFTPPSRAQGFEPDEHTRALFHFDGNLDGASHGHTGPLPARLVNP